MGEAYAFGKNWQRYVAEDLDADREQAAETSLRELVGDLDGKTFLDIGCGSGVHSLAAHRMGAKVTSLDVDRDSVAATRTLKQRAGDPTDWGVIEASILHPPQLEPADVVYSWGVLHHTGRMWDAIDQAAKLVKPGGLLTIAIYNSGRTRLQTPERWRKIKRAYNRLPRPGQIAMEWLYLAYFLQGEVRVRKQNPVKTIRQYRQERGMAFWADIRDWLGGYPYETATAQELLDHLSDFEPVKVHAEPPEGFSNNELVLANAATS